jgi:hypothetical protein
MTNPDGSALSIDKDIFQNCRGASTKVGPFKDVKAGANTFVVRPNSNFDYKAPCGPVSASAQLRRPLMTNGDRPPAYYDLRGRLVAHSRNACPGTGLSRGVYAVINGRSGAALTMVHAGFTRE